MHPTLVRIREATRGTVYEGDLFLVGGAVRDSLLGFAESDDLDLVTEQNALTLARFLFEQGVSTIHPVLYERFGTAMIEVDDSKVELVTARSESYDSDSRKPDVERSSYREDMLRRDFTTNALMRSLETGEVVDVLGTGIQDLESRVLRTPKDPLVTFEDDPLRMLRAVRFRWKLGFEYADGLEEAIRTKRERLKIISQERIREEFTKMLRHPSASSALDDLMRLGLIEMFLPEFMPMVGCDQGHFHHLDVWDHTRLVIENIHKLLPKADDTTLLGGLFHDVAKPSTKQVSESGKVTFYTHEVKGALVAKEIMRRMTYPNDMIDGVASLVKNHMRIGTANEFSDTAARRLLRDMGEDTEKLLALVEADASSLRPGQRVLDLKPVREAIERVQLTTPVNTLKSPLSGEEIMELTGLPSGREVGRIKIALEEAVLDGRLKIDDAESARQIVFELHPWAG